MYVYYNTHLKQILGIWIKYSWPDSALSVTLAPTLSQGFSSTWKSWFLQHITAGHNFRQSPASLEPPGSVLEWSRLCRRPSAPWSMKRQGRGRGRGALFWLWAVGSGLKNAIIGQPPFCLVPFWKPRQQWQQEDGDWRLGDGECLVPRGLSWGEAHIFSFYFIFYFIYIQLWSLRVIFQPEINFIRTKRRGTYGHTSNKIATRKVRAGG